MFVGLNVIGVRMTCERPSCEKRANICSKQNIEKRSKNRSLGWAKRSDLPRRTRRMKGDRSRPFRKIGCKPDKWKVPYPKSYGETFQEDIMVHGVESSAHIKQSKKCHLGPVHSAIDVRQEAEKEGLSRVTLMEPGLTWRKEIIHVQIVKQLTSYQFFNNFRNESNISYRSIARWNRRSSPGCLIIGVTIERFWEDGRTPSRREVLHSRVRNGRRISINSWMRFGGRGSNSDHLVGEDSKARCCRWEGWFLRVSHVLADGRELGLVVIDECFSRERSLLCAGGPRPTKEILGSPKPSSVPRTGRDLVLPVFALFRPLSPCSTDAWNRRSVSTRPYRQDDAYAERHTQDVELDAVKWHSPSNQGDRGCERSLPGRTGSKLSIMSVIDRLQMWKRSSVDCSPIGSLDRRKLELQITTTQVPLCLDASSHGSASGRRLVFRAETSDLPPRSRGGKEPVAGYQPSGNSLHE